MLSGRSAWPIAIVALVTACGDGGGQLSGPKSTDQGCNWTRRTVDRDEVTAVLNMSVAEVGARFHIGEAPWSCRVTWTPLGDQPDATWTPSGVETDATLSLAWGDLAQEVTGKAPPGVRLACPAHLDIEATLTFETTDGSLSETWTVTAQYMEGDDLLVEVHPSEMDGYQGSYTFEWQAEWPETGSIFLVAVHSDYVEGRMTEWTLRETADQNVRRGDHRDPGHLDVLQPRPLSHPPPLTVPPIVSPRPRPHARAALTVLALGIAGLTACTADIQRGDQSAPPGTAPPGNPPATGGAAPNAGSAGKSGGTTGGSSNAGTGGASAGAAGTATQPADLEPGYSRLTQAEYVQTVSAALGVEPDLGLLPVDGRVGPFTSNAAVSPDPVHPYLLAGEDLAARIVPALLPACSATAAASCVRDAYAGPLGLLVRAPASDALIERSAALVTELEAVGVSAEEATRAMLQAALVSPDFLFRSTSVPGDAARGRRLAEHLSYTLWDAAPDAELSAAAEGTAAGLGERLRLEAARLSGDARAVPVLARFVGQWLEVDTDLKLSDPSFASSPVFAELLAAVGDALKTDRPVTELIAGTQGFVQKDNGEAYGLASVPGGGEVVALEWPEASGRRGLLGEELFAGATRHPDATRRPIFRGKLVRKALFCDDIPPPSADLLALAEEVGDRTTDPRCKGCHSLMDPIGRAFSVLDLDHVGDPEPAEVLEQAELAGTYATLPELLQAVAGSNAFSACFARHFLSFFLEVPLDAVDPSFVSELAGSVKGGAGLRSVVEQAVVSLVERSQALTPWCEGP